MYKKFLLLEALKKAREKRYSKGKPSINDRKDFCRLCMARNNKLFCIFNCINRDLAADIQFCTGVLITKTDTLPKTICQSCMQSLKTSYIFKKTCLQTEKRLISLSKLQPVRALKSDVSVKPVKVDVKVEVKDEQFDFDDGIYDSKDDDFISASAPLEPPPTAKDIDVILKPLNCDICGAKFDTLLEKRKHKQIEHKKGKKKAEDKFICELCGKQLANSLTMRGHVKSHQPPNMFCAHCDYKTNNRSDLSKHLKLHTGEKNYQCKYCSRLFTVSSNMHIHIRRVHENDGSKKFTCTLCDAKYTSKISLNRHMDSHYNRRNFECEMCHSRFNNRFSWRKHVKKVHNIHVPSVRGGRLKENFVEHDTETFMYPQNEFGSTVNYQQ